MLTAQSYAETRSVTRFGNNPPGCIQETDITSQTIVAVRHNEGVFLGGGGGCNEI